MLNHIVVMGRLTRDPELRRTASGVAVASFTLAVDRDFSPKDGGEKETDFIDVVAWRSTGEFVSKYFTKGSMAVVSGRLQIRNWTDKDGGKRRSAEIVAENVYFGEGKRNDQQGSYAAPAQGGYAAPAGQAGYAPPAQQGGYAAPAVQAGYAPPAQQGGYAAPAGQPGYAPPAQQGGYGAYGAPAASDFALLEDDDAQLPF